MWETGEERLAVYRLLASQWIRVRSTNGIEPLNEEFRRLVNMQGTLSAVQTAELLFYEPLLTGGTSGCDVSTGARP